ncbi:carboxypeptidase B-like isoform X2 [Photinus pyralis]|nr:carboxypeptidase B-like isoform X2 [Photinus pyralis]
MQDYLRKLNRTYPKIVCVKNFGLSVENRNLTSIKIQTIGNYKKPLIFMDAGMHAREWLGPAQALYIINQLVEDPKNSKLIKKVDWLIVPLVNPDGYEYSHTVDRLWRKNRAKGRICDGVDLNRNFNYQWSQPGASSSECSNYFAGVRPFSEPESLALSKLITENANRIKMYISLHAAAKSILYPWGYTTDLPTNGKELHKLAERFSEAVFRVNSTQYKVGSAANVLYIGSGTSRDWVYGYGNVSLSYTIELKGFDGLTLESRFQIPKENISNALTETFEGLKTLHVYVERRYSF